MQHHLIFNSFYRMQIDTSGLVDVVSFIASPNCDERPAGAEINLLVIHNISLPPDEFGGTGVIELFTSQIDPQAHPYYQSLQGLKVSAHFFIRRDGMIIQFVLALNVPGMQAYPNGKAKNAAMISRWALNWKVAI